MGAVEGAVEGAERRTSSESDDVPVVEVSVSAGGSKASSDARVVDAGAAARLSLAVFVEYVFGREWDVSFEPLVAASWGGARRSRFEGVRIPPETRGCRRRARLAAIHPKLWALHGRIGPTRYFSLILQPFIISPAINVGDIAVAMKHTRI